MKSRIQALNDTDVPHDATPTLTAVGKALGMVPNLHRTLAHAPAALNAYVGMATALGGGVLDPRLREKIALAVAGGNGCTYCASAHTAIGKSLRIDEDELATNLQGRSADVRTAAVLSFVTALLEHRGRVPDASLATARSAGLSEAEIVEVVTHVGMNLFTNMFNEVARTEVDFPLVTVAG